MINYICDKCENRVDDNDVRCIRIQEKTYDEYDWYWKGMDVLHLCPACLNDIVYYLTSVE